MRLAACLLIVVTIALAGCAGNEEAPTTAKFTRTPAASAGTTSDAPIAVAATATQITPTTSPSVPQEPELYPPSGDLQPGAFTFGVVASFPGETLFWDIANASLYLSIPAAQTAVQGSYLGAGYNIAPDDPAVQEVVQQVGTDGTTMEVALELFKWMMENTDYDLDKLASGATDTQSPAQTIAGGEGVCRDLAALYVSLLRGAGIPARIVTGYVGGAVGDFHAWVEFYGGAVGGMPPWVPVDVSVVNGDASLDVLATFFGVQDAENLPMRAWPDVDDDLQWDLSLSVNQTFFGEPADTQNGVLLHVVSEELAWLCMSDDTLARYFLEGDETECPAGVGRFTEKFVRRSHRVLDYGFNVTFHGEATVVLRLSEPLLRPELLPGHNALVYGSPGWTHDPRLGLVEVTMQGP